MLINHSNKETIFHPVTIPGKLFKRYLGSFSHPSKIRIQNFLGRVCFPHGITLSTSAGLRLSLAPNDWITRMILLNGCYEPVSVALACSIMKGGKIFIDIGSNFGLYACNVAAKYPLSRVIAIEANYKILPRLSRNVEMNNVGCQVKIVNSAVSDNNVLLSFIDSKPNNAGTGATQADLSGEWIVAGISLAYLLSQLDITTVDLIKVDIEGNEFSVFREFPFERHIIKNIVMEFNHLDDSGLSDLRMFFKAKGFRCKNVQGELIDSVNDIVENNLWFVNEAANF